ncbi:Hypothetical predicted protein, partial [Paramuricea clavata]
DVVSKAEQYKWQKQEEFTTKQYKDQLRYIKALFGQKIKLEYRTYNNESDKTRVRLLILEITKFDGAIENWLPFWNKFEVELTPRTW